MRISGVSTFLVGNPWKNWLFVRVDTDENIYGVGEGTLNGFSATVEAAIRELEPAYIGQDPASIELIVQRMTRDVYSDGGQIHGSAVAAIEVACWDIMGKVAGRPVHELLGGRVRDRIRAYANGWYRVERTPEAFGANARDVAARGYTALKFDPFGAAWRTQERREEDLSIDIGAAVREAVGGGPTSATMAPATTSRTALNAVWNLPLAAVAVEVSRMDRESVLKHANVNCFHVGRLTGTSGRVWQYTAMDMVRRLQEPPSART
jgi:hypothetical protein